jgi:hypothetical protein
MRWLITTDRSLNLSELEGILRKYNCEIVEGSEPIPLNTTEQVIEVEGPEDLPSLARQEKDILKISPSSKMELYR